PLRFTVVRRSGSRPFSSPRPGRLRATMGASRQGSPSAAPGHHGRVTSGLAQRGGGRRRDRARVATERAPTVAIAMTVPEVAWVGVEEERTLRPLPFEAEPRVGVLAREAEPELD